MRGQHKSDDWPVHCIGLWPHRKFCAGPEENTVELAGELERMGAATAARNKYCGMKPVSYGVTEFCTVLNKCRAASFRGEYSI